MDGHRFDLLARTLAASPSRRTVLSLVGGGTLISLLAVGEAEARKKRKKKKRKKRCKCPSGSGKICQGKKSKTCVCPTGQEDSGGFCGTPPTCLGGGEPCSPEGPNEDCCSGVCLVIIADGFCVNSSGGEPCHTSEQCSNPQSVCRGFVCVSP